MFRNIKEIICCVIGSICIFCSFNYFFNIEMKEIYTNVAVSLVLPQLLKYLWKELKKRKYTYRWLDTIDKLRKEETLKNDDVIRISFAYLFRIKVDGYYLLVKNARGTEKFQPVGGVYKMSEDEARYLRREFSASDDNRIPIDASSKHDYRLLLPWDKLEKFVEHFNKTINRERVDDLSREFKEELIDNEILSFKYLRYRYCGRHFSDITYSQHFGCYELLLADVVEVILNSAQEEELRVLMSKASENYIFALPESIKTLGIEVGTGKLNEFIADHATKILEENDKYLIKTEELDKTYCVML